MEWDNKEKSGAMGIKCQEYLNVTPCMVLDFEMAYVVCVFLLHKPLHHPVERSKMSES